MREHPVLRNICDIILMFLSIYTICYVFLRGHRGYFFKIPFLNPESPSPKKLWKSHLCNNSDISWFLITKRNQKLFLTLNLTLCKVQLYSDLTLHYKSQNEVWLFVYWAGVLNIADSVRAHEQSHWGNFYIQGLLTDRWPVSI